MLSIEKLAWNYLIKIIVEVLAIPLTVISAGTTISVMIAQVPIVTITFSCIITLFLLLCSINVILDKKFMKELMEEESIKIEKEEME